MQGLGKKNILEFPHVYNFPLDSHVTDVIQLCEEFAECPWCNVDIYIHVYKTHS